MVEEYNNRNEEPDGEDIARDLHPTNTPNITFRCEVMKRLDWLVDQGFLRADDDKGNKKPTHLNTNVPVNKWYFKLDDEGLGVPGEFNANELWG